MAVHPKLPGVSGGHDAGQMAGKGQKEPFAAPQEQHSPGVKGLPGLKNDIGEKSGFEGSTASYIDKKGTPFGEAAKFNHMPPGMDIENQEVTDQRPLAMKKVTDISYPGDGWE